jgi:hypothetical protein
VRAIFKSVAHESGSDGFKIWAFVLLQCLQKESGSGKCPIGRPDRIGLSWFDHESEPCCSPYTCETQFSVLISGNASKSLSAVSRTAFSFQANAASIKSVIESTPTLACELRAAAVLLYDLPIQGPDPHFLHEEFQSPRILLWIGSEDDTFL